MNVAWWTTHAFFNAVREPAVAANLSWYHEFVKARKLQLVAHLPSDTGGPAAWDPAIADGLWVRNESFIFGVDDVARPVTPVVAAWSTNPNFTSSGQEHAVPSGWTAWGNGPKSASGLGSACWSVPTPDAKGCQDCPETSMLCNLTSSAPIDSHDPRCDPSTPIAFPNQGDKCSGGFASEPIRVDKGGMYSWSCWVRVDTSHPGNGTGDCSNADNEGTKINMRLLPLNQPGILAAWYTLPGASGNTASSACDGKWHSYTGTMLVSNESEVSEAQFSVTLPATPGGVGYTGAWWTTGVRILKLNAALLNVIRTDSTDINVSDPATGAAFALGRDYTVTAPPLPNRLGGVDLTAWFDQHNAYRVQRVPSGRIKPGQRVALSYDFIPGYVGPVSDGSQCNSFAEPRFYSLMEEAINFTIDTFGSKLIHFNHDEMHGFNRDSRSRALGLSNAELLAHDMNVK